MDIELPRTPAVFEEKTKWPLEPEEAETAEYWGDGNYESAILHMEDIRRQVVEDVTAGAAVRMSVAAATRKYGSRLSISCLGAVLKEPGSEVVRILYDDTNGVHTNNRIRVRDRARCLMIEDLEALLREVEDAGDGGMRFVVVYDIAKAHRLVPVREEDWGLQAFQLTGKPEDCDEGIMYSCGTFGIASAAYWWARVSVAMVRLLHLLTAAKFPAPLDAPGQLCELSELKRTSKGRRASKRKAHVKYCEGFLSWLSLATGRLWPSSSMDLVKYLEARAEEPCGRTVPGAIQRSMVFMEAAGEVAACDAIAKQPGFSHGQPRCIRGLSPLTGSHRCTWAVNLVQGRTEVGETL